MLCFNDGQDILQVITEFMILLEVEIMLGCSIDEFYVLGKIKGFQYEFHLRLTAD